jgi:hypothetical protein
MGLTSTGRRVRGRIGVTLVGILSFGAFERAGAQEPTTLPRVRTAEPAIAAAIARGVERSPVFRNLIATIDASDGVVYLEKGGCGPAKRPCLLHSITISGPNRLLRIRVDHPKPDGCRFVAAIGHELRHAIEVLSDASVRSNTAISLLFRDIGVTLERTVETTAARRTELAVGREMCRRSASDTFTAFVANTEGPSEP